MKLSFVVDKDYLIAHTLANAGEQQFSSEKYKKDIVAFQDYAWDVSSELYGNVPGVRREDLLASQRGIEQYKKKAAQLPNYFTKLKKSKEFRKIYEQTEQYKRFCEREWKQTYLKASKIITELTQLKFDNTFTVLLTHPSLANGTNLRKGSFVFGHAEEWKHYAVIYFWHEILHSYLKSSKLNHALIELITDGELRYRLTGVKYPPFVGHEYLHPIEKKILPYWRKYLKAKNKDFSEFQKQISKLV